jgi:hypothetical protein
LLVLALPDHGGASGGLEAGEDVLHPTPIRLTAWETRALREAVERVCFVILLLEPVLVPHGIGHDAIEGLEPVAHAKFGILESVPVPRGRG